MTETLPEAAEDVTTPVYEKIALTSDIERDVNNAIAAQPNMVVPFILMFGYLYEVANVSAVSDPFWDRLCKFYGDNAESFTHPDKKLIPDDIGATASAAFTATALPSRIRGAAFNFALNAGLINALQYAILNRSVLV